MRIQDGQQVMGKRTARDFERPPRPAGAVEGSDRAWFEGFCREVAPPLFGYALRLAQHRSDAEDLVQEALLRLYGMLTNQQLNRRTARSLAFGVVHNLAMSLHRTKRRSAPPEPGPEPSPERTVEQNLLRTEIDRALGELPEGQRDALLLRTFGGLSYREISETIGASESQVRTWIYRGRRRLADLLDRDGQFVGKSVGAQTHE